MDATPIVVPSVKRRGNTSIGGQLCLIVVWAVMAGFRLDHGLETYLRPVQPYAWVGDLILGVAFLMASVAMSIRLWKQLKTVPSSGLAHPRTTPI